MKKLTAVPLTVTPGKWNLQEETSECLIESTSQKHLETQLFHISFEYYQ